ncbi:MAG: methionine/alanine import family NSS transporter small subunit [Gordonia sp. (in: high G+C Gram-positive bacteria)]|uniref:methionine/alanine import family NSS transporter small subunit n=1 Tax=Gordonia TaxID=2053 RepID=UPI0032648E0F
MTATAIVLLVVAAIVVWGGLLASIVFLSTHPEVTDLPDEDAAMLADDVSRAAEPHPTRDT